MFIISLNKRTSQFDLDFSNNASMLNLGICDNDTMKEVCRNTFLIDKNNKGSINELNGL